MIKEIKRRLKEYGPFGLIGHIYYKQSLTVAEGTLGWLYRDVEYEKTPFINPLYAPLTKKIMVWQNGCGPISLALIARSTSIMNLSSR